MEAWETKARTHKEKASTTEKITIVRRGGDHDPQIAHRREEREGIRVHYECFRPLAPVDACRMKLLGTNAMR